MANSVDPDQTATIGAVCSVSTLFAYILNSSVMLGNYLQQTTSADDIFKCTFSCHFKGCFTYTPNLNRNRTETVTATKLHLFVFGRPFTYEPNPWTKCKKMPV